MSAYAQRALARRRLPAALAATMMAIATAAVGCSDDDSESGSDVDVGEARAFVTEPNLTPPVIDASQPSQGAGQSANGNDFVFLAPKDDDSPFNGLLIADRSGEPVWIHPVKGSRPYDFRVQTYRGEPVLTWWRGKSPVVGRGAGEFVIMNDSYEEIATVTTKGVARADFHEMTITDDGTALLISYDPIQRDLTAVGGPKDGYIVDGVVQEVDIETGEVLFEWRASNHIPLTETRSDLQTHEDQDGSEDAPFDPYHLNSVTEDGRALLISARNTHAVYRVGRETGQVDWTLGGSGSDFAMGAGTTFAWQHDAQRRADGTITLFDNSSAPPVDDESRGIRLRLNPQTRIATLVTEYLPPDGRLAESQGNLQVLPNGNVFIGWGALPFYSEYTRDGKLVLDGELSGGESYRAYQLPWTGDPQQPPKLVVENGTAYVSWNGATEVARWRFVAGENEASATEVETAVREGFETSVEVPNEPYVAAQALDASGEVLATVQR